MDIIKQGFLGRLDDPAYFTAGFVAHIDAIREKIPAWAGTLTLSITEKEQQDYSGDLTGFLLAHRISHRKHYATMVASGMTCRTQFGPSVEALYVPGDEFMAQMLMLYKGEISTKRG